MSFSSSEKFVVFVVVDCAIQITKITNSNCNDRLIGKQITWN